MSTVVVVAGVQPATNVAGMIAFPVNAVVAVTSVKTAYSYALQLGVTELTGNDWK